MLAELAAANAAFAVIKQAVSNGKEIAAAGSAIAQFVGAKEKLEKTILLKRLGDPIEIGNTVSFLLSDRSSYINGQIISVDGGSSIY